LLFWAAHLAAQIHLQQWNILLLPVAVAVELATTITAAQVAVEPEVIGRLLVYQ